ncbi:MAG: hypothetical protein ABI338_07475 [Gemmatimonadaceae bacterium]
MPRSLRSGLIVPGLCANALTTVAPWTDWLKLVPNGIVRVTAHFHPDVESSRFGRSVIALTNVCNQSDRYGMTYWYRKK